VHRSEPDIDGRRRRANDGDGDSGEPAASDGSAGAGTAPAGAPGDATPPECDNRWSTQPHRSLTMKKSRARRRKARLGRFLQSRAKL